MTEKQRRMLYLQEMESMAQTAKSMMEDISHAHIAFIQATHIQHINPMFKVRTSTAELSSILLYCARSQQLLKY